MSAANLPSPKHTLINSAPPPCLAPNPTPRLQHILARCTAEHTTLPLPVANAPSGFGNPVGIACCGSYVIGQQLPPLPHKFGTLISGIPTDLFLCSGPEEVDAAAAHVGFPAGAVLMRAAGCSAVLLSASVLGWQDRLPRSGRVRLPFDCLQSSKQRASLTHARKPLKPPPPKTPLHPVPRDLTASPVIKPIAAAASMGVVRVNDLDELRSKVAATQSQLSRLYLDDEVGRVGAVWGSRGTQAPSVCKACKESVPVELSVDCMSTRNITQKVFDTYVIQVCAHARTPTHPPTHTPHTHTLLHTRSHTAGRRATSRQQRRGWW
jgi:hypothetical protein